MERTGAFSPSTWLFGSALGLAGFVTTDDTEPDSDGDGLLDGEELERTPLAEDPTLAGHYGFLIDRGLEDYYKFRSDPNDPDTDGDGLNDLNDPDPLDFDELGVDGLDLPVTTLFQPSTYDDEPAVPSGFTWDEDDPNIPVTWIRYNDEPVVYDSLPDLPDLGLRFECAENCTEVEALVTERPNDNGFGICVGGFVFEAVRLFDDGITQPDPQQPGVVGVDGSRLHGLRGSYW